jgi:hypothetical protein
MLPFLVLCAPECRMWRPVAAYKGSGSTDDAATFVCKVP